MKMTAECIYCTIAQLDRNFTVFEKDPEKRMAFLRKVCAEFGASDVNMTAPEFNAKLMQEITALVGKQDLFEQEKRIYNQAILKMESEIQQHIDDAPDQLYRSLQYAMTGNYIDFGTSSTVSEDKLHELIRAAINIDLGPAYAKLKADLEKAKTLVYVLDNCGEIVFDKLCIAQIKMLYPDLGITAVVRGLPIINDVTMVDAIETGLTDIVPVETNGIALQGMLMHQISEQSRKRMNSADVIIAKGMGNFETLEGCGLNVYYLFLCKCERFVQLFNKPRYASIFLAEEKQNIPKSAL